MADPIRRPYLDAQSWVSALSGKGPYAEDLAEWLAAADRAEMTIIASVLMSLEVLGGPHSERTQAAADQAEQALRRTSVLQVNLTRRIVTDARQLRIEHGLRAMDAIHVASAVAGRADVLLSNDDKLCRLGSFRDVLIIRPTWVGDVGLFEV